MHLGELGRHRNRAFRKDDQSMLEICCAARTGSFREKIKAATNLHDFYMRTSILAEDVQDGPHAEFFRKTFANFLQGKPTTFQSVRDRLLADKDSENAILAPLVRATYGSWPFAWGVKKWSEYGVDTCGVLRFTKGIS